MALLLVAGAHPALGQRSGPEARWPDLGWVPASEEILPESPLQELEGSGSIAEPTLLSLVLPGAGQHALGQQRKWLYAALEVAGWTVFLERRAGGIDFRDRYRDFAWETGRIQNGPRADGDFDYYEALTKWSRSGAFDSDASAPGVQPEEDASTFNGSIWARAQLIFLPGGGSVLPSDPSYQAAVDYYAERAYGSDFLWDWSGAPGEQQELADLIETSDSRFRQATTAVGVVIANHLISAADAYISARARLPPARLRVFPGRPESPGGVTAVLSIAAGPR